MYQLLGHRVGSAGTNALILVAVILSSVYMNAQGATRMPKQAPPAQSAAAQTYTETIVHQFQHFGGDGAEPVFGLVSDGLGNVYGVTNEGGSGEQGALFELTPNGSGSMAYNFIASFGGGPTFLTFDNQGNLYVILGNALGALLELSKGTDGNWVTTNGYSFTGTEDGARPSMVQPDNAGNVYGTTVVVFKLEAADDQWLEQTLFAFPDPVKQGASPDAIVLDTSGDLYGMSSGGGPANGGTFFKLTPGDTGWNETVLHNFQGGVNAASYPIGTLTLGPDGDFYGVALYSGQQSSNPLCCGGVYKITKWGKVTWLYTFTGGADGSNPATGVTFDKEGNLYGVTANGGSFAGQYCGYGCGVVYKLTHPAGNQDGPWTENVLYSFSGGLDGYEPVGPVILDSAENIYGVTAGGGDGYGIGGDGVVFELSPNAVPTGVNITRNTPNPSLTGQVVRVSFAVAQTVAGVNPPTGTVTVTANTGESCFEPLRGNGKGSCELLFPTAGTRTLTATYSGDSGNLSSVSTAITQNVMNVTTTAITRNTPDPAKIGQPVTVEFNVVAKNATTKTRPTGNVTVTASTGESCTGAVSGSGLGNCKLTFTSSGARTLTATYGGDVANEGSVSIAAAETVD
jgi:uncharacterized repeat protein (TIGR03803 family)